MSKIFRSAATGLSTAAGTFGDEYACSKVSPFTVLVFQMNPQPRWRVSRNTTTEFRRDWHSATDRMIPMAVTNSPLVQGNNASETHAANAGVMTGNAQAAGNSASQAHLANAGVMSGNASSVGASASQTHLADAGALTTATTASGNGASHTHASDAGALTGHASTTGNNATHAHLADAGSVTASSPGTPLVSGNSATQAHTADSGNVSATSSVTPGLIVTLTIMRAAASQLYITQHGSRATTFETNNIAASSSLEVTQQIRKVITMGHKSTAKLSVRR